jgi:hypothetical protein
MIATFYLGRTHLVRGEFSDAVAFLERNVALEGALAMNALGPSFSRRSRRSTRHCALRARPVR